MNIWEIVTVIVLVAACAAIVILPPDYDPAIRLKEWAERNRR